MDLCNVNVVKRIMSKYGTGTKKAFGQNFLINPQVPADIAYESYSYHKSKNGDDVSGALEIGPGIGSLTSELCQAYDRVVAVEIDSTLIPILGETLGEYDNITVINKDFLKLDLNSFLDEHFGDKPVSVCANLPYYITTPIIMKLLAGSAKAVCHLFLHHNGDRGDAAIAVISP